MNAKPTIPKPPPSDSKQRADFDSAVKETLDVITGRRGGRVKRLNVGASTDEVIAKINELIDLLQ